jgi:NAD(P)-dependent dehydrogenase (short-subunit alcohol dehydrogenase family)
MQHEIAVITGANTGMGYQTARSLALQGYHVVATGRDEMKLQDAALAINTLCEQAGTDGVCRTMLLDLESFASVSHFAYEFGLIYDHVDVLICNAGIMNGLYRITENGYEAHFQVNYLSHHLLCRLMLPYLGESSRPRIIQVTSTSGVKGASEQLDNFIKISQVKKSDFSGLSSYRESKLAQMLLTRYMHTYLGASIFTAAANPGVVNSDLFYRQVPRIVKSLIKPLVWVGYVTDKLKSPTEGADTTIWLAATEDNVPGGRYWKDRAQVPWADSVMNDALAKSLWDWSGQITSEFCIP